MLRLREAGYRVSPDLACSEDPTLQQLATCREVGSGSGSLGVRFLLAAALL